MFQTTNWHLQPAEGILMPSLRKYSSLAAIFSYSAIVVALNDKLYIMRHLLTCIFILLFKVSYSCSCFPLGKIDEKQYSNYDLILKGKIVKVTNNDFQTNIVIRVRTYYKGIQKKTTVTIISPKGDAQCGISPNVGENWLVFAKKENKIFHTSLCTRTKNMNPKVWNYRKDEILDDINFLEGKCKINGG